MAAVSQTDIDAWCEIELGDAAEALDRSARTCPALWAEG